MQELRTGRTAIQQVSASRRQNKAIADIRVVDAEFPRIAEGADRLGLEEVAEQRQLGCTFSGRRWGRQEFERVLAPLVPPLPDRLRIERRIARMKHRLRRLLVLRDEVAQFLGRNVDARVLLVANRRDLGR